jgi:transglutaminase-like putative cysteine protease
MLFEIVHRTDYRYPAPASEAYIEARLTPVARAGQDILNHAIEFSPETPYSHYTDYFGNRVTFYSMTHRHARLGVVNRMTVRTREVPRPVEALDVPVAEARQLFASVLTDVFDFLQSTPVVPTGGPATEWAKKHFAGDRPLRRALDSLNSAVHTRFRYQSGATDTGTPLAVVWRQRSGVCQDFAHIMLSVLRTAGIPSRYVCGYIETDPPKDAPGMVGAVATHAWVEVLAPGMNWVALDPTNNQWCGERHVTVATGRDFQDAAPVRGTFKGTGSHTMKVRVTMKRLEETP